MGYSCSAAASATERSVLSAVCLEQTGTQNTYVGTDGVERFYEPSRTEHPDGSITGSVWRLVDGLAHPSGNFRIAGDGTITRWPSHFPRDLVQA